MNIKKIKLFIKCVLYIERVEMIQNNRTDRSGHCYVHLGIYTFNADISI